MTTRHDPVRRRLLPVRYEGQPPHAVHAITAGVRLPLRHYVRHSPTGFSWGYYGSGPADLARSLLWDALGAEPHPALYQRYKADVVAHWEADQPWTTTRDDIRGWVIALLTAERDTFVGALRGTGARLLDYDGTADS